MTILTSESFIEDRRKKIRFKVNDLAFGVTNPQHETICNILDISYHGIGISYLAEKRIPNSIFKLDLFLRGNGYFARQISCKTASEFIEPLNHPFRMIPLMRVGALFTDLSSWQIMEIEKFIETCTVGYVSDRRCGCDRRLLAKRNPDFFHENSIKISKSTNNERRKGEDRRKN